MPGDDLDVSCLFSRSHTPERTHTNTHRDTSTVNTSLNLHKYTLVRTNTIYTRTSKTFHGSIEYLAHAPGLTAREPLFTSTLITHAHRQWCSTVASPSTRTDTYGHRDDVLRLYKGYLFVWPSISSVVTTCNRHLSHNKATVPIGGC